MTLPRPILNVQIPTDFASGKQTICFQLFAVVIIVFVANTLSKFGSTIE